MARATILLEKPPEFDVKVQLGLSSDITFTKRLPLGG